MNKTIAFWTVPLLGLMLCLFAASNASAARPYGWYYPGYAPVVAPAYGYGYGVVATPYGYTYNPRRAYRQAIRYGYVRPVVVAPAPVYAYPPYYYAPYYGPTRGPRDYMYRPGYQRPLVPAPAVPQAELLPVPLAE